MPAFADIKYINNPVKTTHDVVAGSNVTSTKAHMVYEVENRKAKLYTADP